MTTPVPQPAPVTPGVWTARRFLFVIAAVLFVIGAFAFGGDALGTIPAWTWLAAGFAAWALSGAVP